ncbi:MAG: rhodanese-like domain-containing protein [Gammaproteobacteria bacterium]
MSFPTIAPEDTAAQIGAAGTAIYVDVRTVAEFVQGRPKGRAINLPIVFHHPKTGEDHPNDAFELVANHAIDPATPLIVGGDGDARADLAAARLAAAGFDDVKVMGSGLTGWRAAALPVTGDNRDGVSYASLLTAARRAKA